MATVSEYEDWIKRLHAIAEEFRSRDQQTGIVARILRRLGFWKKRPDDQYALRWSANIVAEKRNEIKYKKRKGRK